MTLLASEQTAAAEEATIESQQQTPISPDEPNSTATIETLATQSAAVQATNQAIQNEQQRLVATLTAIAEPIQTFACSSEDYIPEPGGGTPPIDRQVCISEGRIAWISSDPAYFEIPGTYSESIGEGFTFALFGPVKFTISGVPQQNVRLDVRLDESLVGNYDGKSHNLIYQNGKVCAHTEFTGSFCP